MREYLDLSLISSVKLKSLLENVCVNWNLFMYIFVLLFAYYVIFNCILWVWIKNYYYYNLDIVLTTITTTTTTTTITTTTTTENKTQEEGN